MGNLMYDGDIGEIALLVRDDWQRRGVGSVLAARLVEEAQALGIATLSAHTHVDNTAIARTLRKAGLKLVGAPEPGEWCWMKATAPAVA
ncbi:GNAT family N-acetyltransferase [Saccharopolyspora spinosporotrichia]